MNLLGLIIKYMLILSEQSPGKKKKRDAHRYIENATEAWRLKRTTDHHGVVQHSRGMAMDPASRESLIARRVTHHLRK